MITLYRCTYTGRGIWTISSSPSKLKTGIYNAVLYFMLETYYLALQTEDFFFFFFSLVLVAVPYEIIFSSH